MTMDSFQRTPNFPGTEILTTLELENMKCEVVCQPLPNTISFDRTELLADNGSIVKTKVGLLLFALEKNKELYSFMFLKW